MNSSVNAEQVTNEDSILASVKKMLGLEVGYTPFDKDVIMYVNSVFLDLNQIGVGPDEGYSIIDYEETWLDFDTNESILNAIKPYIYLKVRLLFDPPTSSSVLNSFEKMIERFEWRINLAVELLNKKEGV